MIQKPNPLVKENIFTVANSVTLLRVILSVIFFYLAFTRSNSTLNLIGLGIHWSLDILDGFLARKLNQETLFGAQIDILADRLLLLFFYAVHLMLHPSLVIPIGLFLIEFVFLDGYLSLQFLNWGIISPNYFYKIDDLVWKFNWSALGKAANTALVTILLILFDTPLIATVIVIILIAIKISSFVWLQYTAKKLE